MLSNGCEPYLSILGKSNFPLGEGLLRRHRALSWGLIAGVESHGVGSEFILNEGG